MIRRLIENKKIGVARGEPRQGGAVLLAAAQAADALKDHVSRDAKPREQIAPLLFQKLLVPRTHKVEGLYVAIEPDEQLVKVPWLDSRSQNDSPRIGRELPHQAPE